MKEDDKSVELVDEKMVGKAFLECEAITDDGSTIQGPVADGAVSAHSPVDSLDVEVDDVNNAASLHNSIDCPDVAVKNDIDGDVVMARFPGVFFCLLWYILFLIANQLRFTRVAYVGDGERQKQ